MTETVIMALDAGSEDQTARNNYLHVKQHEQNMFSLVACS